MWSPLTRSGRDERRLELLLRIGVAGCFIGHGAFGVIGKVGWLPYFAALGIPEGPAWILMPMVGSVDILVGILALVSPRPVILGYAAFWATWTAVLRPLAGESPFEVLERAGNYGIPLVFLLLAAVRMDWSKAWLKPVAIDPMTPVQRARIMAALRGTTATLLLGHGGLALLGKPMLAEHLGWVGIPATALPVVGAVEVGMAIAVALRPLPPLLLFVLVWKVGTEALFPLTGAPIWEFVERAGSYIAPLALWTLVRDSSPGPVARGTVQGRASAGFGFLALPLLAAPLAMAPTEPWASSNPIHRWRSAPSVSLQDSTLLTALREGGHVLACRHAITDRSRQDREDVDFSDPTTQRVLSSAGRRQAQDLGRVLRRLAVPVSDIQASPFDRTVESARLAFGRTAVNDVLSLRGPGRTREVRALLTDVPEDGNRLLMTHQGILYGVMPHLERGSIREGDCVVVRPSAGAEGFVVVGRFGNDEWAQLDAPGQSLAPAIEAALAGGNTLLCRHARTGNKREVEPVDYADPSTQRLLSPEGERQSREMGEAMRRLGIQITELVASPMSRAHRTAELMFDLPVRIEPIWHTNGGTYRGPALRQRQQVLASPVDQGNRLIVSHIGTISSVIPTANRTMEEGDCAVVESGGRRHRLLGFVTWQEWGLAAN